MKIINWIAGLFKDEKGIPSSKRFVGIIAGLTLCATLFFNQCNEDQMVQSPILINAVAALAFGALSLSSVDKFKYNKNKED
jgi:xanthine/uracil permease